MHVQGWGDVCHWHCDALGQDDLALLVNVERARQREGPAGRCPGGREEQRHTVACKHAPALVTGDGSQNDACGSTLRLKRHLGALHKVEDVNDGLLRLARVEARGHLGTLVAVLEGDGGGWDAKALLKLEDGSGRASHVSGGRPTTISTHCACKLRLVLCLDGDAATRPAVVTSSATVSAEGAVALDALCLHKNGATRARAGGGGGTVHLQVTVDVQLVGDVHDDDTTTTSHAICTAAKVSGPGHGAVCGCAAAWA